MKPFPRVRLLPWVFAGLLLGHALRAAETADPELCPLYPTLVTIAENGRLTHALRAIDVHLLRYPGDARLPALRTRIVQQLSYLNTVPVPLPPSRPPLPIIAHARPDPGHDFTSPTAGIPLLWIAPGSFRLANPQGSDDDTLVTLSRGFWLGRTEITQTQWRAVMENLPSPSFFDGSDRPVESVSWVNAVEFCQKLTARERASGRVPEGYVYALPTEAQWEYACRAGTTGPAPGVLADLGWFDTNSDRQTHPVGQKQPNPWGLHDMHGNVSEWCADGYSGYPGGEVVDRYNAETGEAAAMYKVQRGGGFTSTEGQCRSGFRTRGLLTYASSGVGFRVALAPVRDAETTTVIDSRPDAPGPSIPGAIAEVAALPRITRTLFPRPSATPRRTPSQTAPAPPPPAGPRRRWEPAGNPATARPSPARGCP